MLHGMRLTRRPTRFAVPAFITAAMLLGAALSGAYAQSTGQPGMLEVRLGVSGLSCPFCAFGLEKKLNEVENVASLDIQMEEGVAVVEPKAGTSIDLRALEQAVEKAGFTPRRIELSARGRLGELDGRPVLKLPDGMLVLADDHKTQALVAEAQGKDVLVRVDGVAELRQPEGHAGHPYTLVIESFQVG